MEFCFPILLRKKPPKPEDIWLSEKMYTYGPGKFNLFINLWTLELVFGAQGLKWTKDGQVPIKQQRKLGCLMTLLAV